MLINAQHREELRIAIVDGDVLDNFQIEVPESGLTRGNVYLGIVTNLQPSLNAAFVSYGAQRDGFLPMKEIIPAAYQKQVKNPHRVNEVLERGKPLIVQVTKEAEGQKGAALTTDVSLAGRYLVLTPFEDTRGVSRKVEDEEARATLKEQAAALKVPKGGGFIIRTNALGQSKATLTKDFTTLLRAWKRIQADAKGLTQPALLHRDQDLIIRVLRDHLDQGVTEMVIDDESAYEVAARYVKDFMPRTKLKLVRYTDREPLFARYGIETQIARIFDRTVQMKSGASIVIDQTEALVAIDVNSGKSTRAASQEDLAYNTNIEAAAEVARQLRLRDLGGLIVVDFIDMRAAKNRAAVEKTLREAMKSDKARSTIGKISPNGLLEINRQRMQQSLHMRTHRPCPTCSGTGRIASPEMVSGSLLRRIEQRAVSGNLRKVRIALHPELADAFQNQRRQQIAQLEREFSIQVEVIAASHLHRPQQEVEFIELPQPQQPKEAPAPAPPQPAAAAQPASVAAADAMNGNGKKKRRRRKKKGHGESVPPADAVASPAAAAGADSPVVDVAIPDVPLEVPSDAKRAAFALPIENGGEPRKRRRRKKKKGGAAEEAAVPEPAINGVDTAPVPQESVTEVALEGRKRKRRRRRRGGRDHDASRNVAVTALPEVTHAPVQPPPHVAAVAAEPPRGAVATERTPLSGRRRRKPVTQPEVAPRTEEASVSAPASEAADVAAGPERRRTPRRAKSTAAAPAEQNEVEAPKRTRGRRAPAAPREAAPAADSPDPKPTRTRSPKARTPRRSTRTAASE